ncbi:MAG: response regulator receiver [Limisphaerales bacterium]|nr:MAG: response regulator receiver [Limisphaerales bacterium]KAG0506855.1 MAG: response regulator receiver [Limisphaerales bacterium]TXT49852.1 MAG: response regulator receiver [Limisphaerales bacterium]
MPPVPVKPPPARSPGALPPRAGMPPAQKVGAKVVQIVRPRVLAVDDTPDALRQLRDCLKALNAECFTCGSGNSAVEFLGKELVDLAIVDVSMPGMDGFEVCRAIKHDPRTADIPVILVTGDIKSEDTNRGIELGAFDYLTKPVDPHECTVRVHAALQMKRLMEELKVQLMAPEEQRRAQAELTQKMTDFQHGMTTTHWQKRFGQLAASFVDDIHFPLAHALASLQILMVDERLKDDVRQRLLLLHAQFRKVNDHLRRLINISVYSRSPQLLRPAELVADVTRLLEPEFTYHGIVLDLQLDPTIEWWGMRSEISRAILYLLHNAIEAHTEKGPVIKRRFEDEGDEEPSKDDPNKVPIIMVLAEQTGDTIVIQIRDNGPGIPPELHERIWDPYFTTKTPPHTGAGLHLARAIVRAAGGEIQLQSPGPACSTQFSVVLPVNVILEEPPVEEAPPEEPSPEEAEPSLSEEADAALTASQAQEEEPAAQA